MPPVQLRPLLLSFHLPLPVRPPPLLHTRTSLSPYQQHSSRPNRPRLTRVHTTGALLSAPTPPPPPPSPPRPPPHTPSDLVRFRRSPYAAHLSELHRHAAHPARDTPTALDAALSRAGIAHEARVLAHLAALLAVPLPPPARTPAATFAALRARQPLVPAAALRGAGLRGVADALLLASADPFATPAQRAAAAEGDYIVCEIKLASLHTADFALQAAAYAAMLAEAGEVCGAQAAGRAYVFVGAVGERPKAVKLRSLMYLLRRTQREYDEFLKGVARGMPLREPDGPLERLRPWSEYAAKGLEDTDSLQLVAGMRRAQQTTIVEEMGVQTLEAFAAVDEGVVESVVRLGGGEGLRKLHLQAKMQMETRRRGGATAYEVMANAERLPVGTSRDVFFDMEGYPLMEGGSLEYLFGCCTETEFRHWWAHNRVKEEEAFVTLLEWLTDVRKVAEGESKPHIYHYGHYEVTALKRVALRAKTVAGLEAGRLLENLIEDGAFVDVYKVITNSLVIGEASYSIKKVEKLVGISRQDDDLADAESSVAMYYEWRRSKYADEDADDVAFASCEHAILREILDYNRQDCESLKEVVAWLMNILPQMAAPEMSSVAATEIGEASTKDSDPDAQILPGACGPSQAAKEVDSLAIRKSMELSKAMLDMSVRGLAPGVRLNLSQLLHFYVRESSPSRMQFSDRVGEAAGPNSKNLLDDDQCLAGVAFVGERPDPKKPGKTWFEYTFPIGQASMLAEGNSAAFVVPQGDPKAVVDGPREGSISCFMSIKGFREGARPGSHSVLLSAGKRLDFKPPLRGVLVSSEDLKICDAPLRQSLLRSAEKLSENPNDPALSLFTAFLNKTAVDAEYKDAEVTQRLGLEDDRGRAIAEFLASRTRSCVFVIQGPPGSGKTSLSAEIIRDLVMKHGKTIAVSSNSHAAIDNLLASAIKAGTRQELVYKIGTRSTNDQVGFFKSNLRDVVVTAYSASEVDGIASSLARVTLGERGGKRKPPCPALVGATCYQLGRADSQDKFDFLFVDEASQVTIANFLAMAPCANYAVLVGDQQQLQMPIKGAHPGDLDRSCLGYLAGDETTVPPSRGIFLERSYRMTPEICNYISDAYYDNALSPAANCITNRVHLNAYRSSQPALVTKESGILFVPCKSPPLATSDVSRHGKWHRPAEVEVVCALVQELLGMRFTVGDRTGVVSIEDILVVAPYNAQVRALRESLASDIRVGTVDKFQGQEAPITLISTCASLLTDDDYETNAFGCEGDGNWSQSVSLALDSSMTRSERRGLRFALQKNRLNVALSRAQCLAIVTGDPEAFANMPLSNMEDVDVAATYEYLVTGGEEGF